MTKLHRFLNCRLRDFLPGVLRVWHCLLAVALLATLLVLRNPGGRPFDGDLPAPPPTPFTDLDDPTNIVAALRASFDADNQPTPVVLHLARACDAVYASGETSIPRLFFDTRFDEVVPIGWDSNYVVVGFKDNIAVIVFRGTDEIEDWYTNLSVRWTPVDHGRMHTGFWKAYQGLRKDIIEALSSRDLQQVWISGHSLGGAMALCCAYDLSNSTSIPITGVVTFGQPKLADGPLASHINKVLQGKYLAVVADEDPVADTVPLCHFCGSAIWFNGDRLRYDRGLAEAMGESLPMFSEGPLGSPDDEPFFEDVMSVEELRRNQELLRMEFEPMSDNTDQPQVYASSLPFFSDHNMSNYISKLRNHFSSTDSKGGR